MRCPLTGNSTWIGCSDDCRESNCHLYPGHLGPCCPEGTRSAFLVPVRVDVQIIVDPGVTVIAEAFFATADKLQNMQPLLRDMVELISTEIDLNFQMQGRPSKLQPLAASTLQRRAF